MTEGYSALLAAYFSRISLAFDAQEKGVQFMVGDSEQATARNAQPLELSPLASGGRSTRRALRRMHIEDGLCEANMKQHAYLGTMQHAFEMTFVKPT